MKRVLILFVMIVMAVSNVMGQELSFLNRLSDEYDQDMAEFNQLQEKANAGDAKSQMTLGDIYNGRIEYEHVGMNWKTALGWYQKAVAQNYVPAYSRIAEFYMSGEGVPKSTEEALKWIRKGVANNDADAQYELGKCYLIGSGVETDTSEAEKHFKMAAAQGNKYAKTQLSLLQLISKGKTGDLKAQKELGDVYSSVHPTIYSVWDSRKGFSWYSKQAFFLYKMAADKNYIPAYHRVGYYYMNGSGVEKNEVEGIMWIKKGADSNNADAQFELGKCYADGKGVLQNMSEAIKYFTSAATGGNVEAQAKLGLCYLEGSGVKQNAQQAVVWMKKAAVQNYEDADLYYQLGKCYAVGNGVGKNNTEALKWYKKVCEMLDDGYVLKWEVMCAIAEITKDGALMLEAGYNWYIGGDCYDPEQALHCFETAAEWGYHEAEYMMGYVYKYPQRGVEKDEFKSIMWFTKAAEHGNMYAQVELGDCYFYGDGVEKNYAEAVKWYRKAAEQDDAYSQAMISFCYAQGLGVEANMVEGRQWADKAIAHDDGVGAYQLGWLFEAIKDIDGAKKLYELAAKKGHKGAEKALAKLNGNSASTTASSKSSTSKQTTASNTNFTPNFTFKSTVPSDLNLQDDVVLENKTKYLIKNIAVYKKGVLMFSKQNVTPGSEKKVMYSNKDELSYYLGAELEFRLESTEAKQANDELYVEISQESHDMLITIKSSLGTKDKKMNSVWDKTKTFVKEKSEKASEKTKELINKVKK